jgi:polysaccharide biosynthesis/export protein
MPNFAASSLNSSLGSADTTDGRSTLAMVLGYWWGCVMRRQSGLLLIALVTSLSSLGCMADYQHMRGPLDRAGPPLAIPVDGSVPRELSKIVLPEYVIEPPDVLRIEAVIREPEEDPKTKKKVPTDKIRSLPLQPVFGEYAVRPDGTVFLGVYGEVQVAGYTLKQAAQAIRDHVSRKAFQESDGLSPEFLLVVLDVTQYNSKKYYVFLDGGGAGEQVFSLPITGSDTVLDALAAVNGLPPVASKRNIWIARRTPHANNPEQILPVDWVGISQHGMTSTNYQIMPGDRVYVKAQRLVTIDNTLARVFAPVEKVFGVTLLGASTYNQISGRGNGFNTAR